MGKTKKGNPKTAPPLLYEGGLNKGLTLKMPLFGGHEKMDPNSRRKKRADEWTNFHPIPAGYSKPKKDTDPVSYDRREIVKEGIRGEKIHQ